MKTMNNYTNATVNELKKEAKSRGLSGYSKLRKEELIFMLNNDDAVKAQVAEDAKREYDEAKAFAKNYCLRNFDKAVLLYKQTEGVKKMTAEDWYKLVELWKLIEAFSDPNLATDDIIQDIADAFFDGVDISKMSTVEKGEFVAQAFQYVSLRIYADIPTKRQYSMLKNSFGGKDFTREEDGWHTDKTHAVGYEWEDLDGIHKAVPVEGGTSRMVETAEDGISRILEEKGIDIISTFMGVTGSTPEEQAVLDALKLEMFCDGFTDDATGAHYMFSHQSASSTRVANFTYAKADEPEDICDIWVEVSGLKSWQGILDSNLFKHKVNDKGETVYMVNLSKFLARLAMQSSNSLDINKLATEEVANKIRNWNVANKPDMERKYYRDCYTIDRPGHMEFLHNSERKLVNGDGAGFISYSASFDICAGMRLISMDEYAEVNRLWAAAGKDLFNVIPGSRLDILIMKMPCVFQDRHGADKGTLVRVNLERFEVTKDIDVIIPESVRKFDGGEWKDYPLLICDYVKNRNDYVALNPQFIASLEGETPNLLVSLAEHWFKVMEESLDDPAKAQKFHGLVKNIDDEGNADDPLLVQALRTCSDLVDDRQVCNWRREQYEKFINNMKIGRILLPGQYTYMVPDPYDILKLWYGEENIDFPTLEAGEYYNNGKTCKAGLFRSPLIHPFEAQRVQLVDHLGYRHFKNVMVFNNLDGIWELMGGADYDGDKCEIIHDDNEFGKIIVDAIRDIPWDVYDEKLSAQMTEFTNTDFNYFYKEILAPYLVKSAHRDRTGLISNYGMRAMDISNHLTASIYFAKRLNCTKVLLMHPNEFIDKGLQMPVVGENGKTEMVPDKFGATWTPQVVTTDAGERVFAIRGLVKVEWDKVAKKYVFDNANGKFGLFTFDEVTQLADDYEWIARYTRSLVMTEIDGAKTGVYAEGLAGEDHYDKDGNLVKGIPGGNFVDAVKVTISSQHFLARQETLGRPVTKKARNNSYVSLSPLGRLYTYVSANEHRVIEKLENGCDKSWLLQGLLTLQEQSQLQLMLSTPDGKQLSLVEYIGMRKHDYNMNLRNIMGKFAEDEVMGVIRKTKELEINTLKNLADSWGLSYEVMSVACYLAAYAKTSKQNQSLSYGWLMSGELLSVFSRANKQLIQIRLPKKTYEASIKNGFIFVNGEAYMHIDADDRDYLPLWTSDDGEVIASIRRKLTDVTLNRKEVVYANKTYTIGLYGFRHYFAGVADPTRAFLDIVKDNGFVFDIIIDTINSRQCVAVNGQTIGSLMPGADFELMGHTVKITNQPKINNASIQDVEVVILQ